ncbi:tyrosine-protein phosphatase [Paenarthrobacter aurescens]|uniref:Protein-tyrosine-phosphatase n=1 Tax=Paenarthrobacter aurescens TaxID=43663 RepID=A0A4Y3NFA5_PAEAU|nr:tyrosine-protein phosphatase [Paenarthrobacter aurescens]MDO6144628.1 tyrosine-protein phosphatase [Paenarthrobacter aurescens]MDO6148473.1 tyrosine-protein phosphatase [Paenarthrobacter aurescens]MDO6159719.1 tyrosine-protein phosphatase [Paenarthrobacter aurescens]MDO6164621.1 tyrosine-protein phosphatase [Paenarthrobacter aurescens]GEB17711.1 protein-tyrosine-phosphatase [Paenarthrobacter aurescens]
MDGTTSAHQDVHWDGAVNAWRIAGGVYRMGRHEWVTESGWQQMYDDGVRTVIDLRASRERRQRDTDPEVPDEAKARIDVVHCPTEDPDHRDFSVLFGPYLKDPAQYGDYLELFADRIAAVFKVIAASPGKVVVHCSAGRDRSGVIAVMLQRLAGAGDEEIVQGYELAARGINERHRTHGAPHAHDPYLSEVDLGAVLAGRRESLRVFLASLDVVRFLSAHGVSDPELEAVRAKLGVAGPS